LKVAVYNRYWRSLGGGEKYGGFVAQCLAEKHDVELLAHEPLDKRLIKERLDVDLSQVGIRLIPEEDDIVFAYETRKYDLLVNTTFGSDAMCHASHGLYICHFPLPRPPIKTGLSALIERVRPKAPSLHTHIEWGDGWFGHEQAKHVYRWSTERPTLYAWTPKGVETPVQLIFLRAQPRGADPTELSVSVDGEVVKKVRIEPGRGSVRVDLVIKGSGMDPTLIQMSCNTFRPYEQFGLDDPRHLGVAMVADQTGKPANGYTYSRRRYVGGPQLYFLDSYDRIVSNSEYTRMWVSRLWKRPSQVINPPVSLHARAEKEPIILSVGRFFDRTGGHSKKQVEMVEAFRTLVGRGLNGWTYHLVGGCESRDIAYLERLRLLAGGLPIEIHVDATGAQLKDLYARASIYWHATGLGEDERRFPERFEHFGITTVEAMSAGAVPIVIGKAGQLEVLVDGVHGRHFKDLDELVNITWEVTHDDQLLQRYSHAAEERARQFGPDIFKEKLNEVVEEILGR
jgi:glycosyltransferase involved in cell wall biosynthesis